MAAPVAALVLVGCGVSAEDGFRTVDSVDVPYGLGDPTPAVTTTAAPGDTGPVVVWFVDGEEVSDVVRPTGSTEPEELIEQLVAGPTDTDPGGLRTALAGDLVAGTDVTGRSVAVHLTAAFQELVPSEQRLAVAQIVLTLTAVPTILDVRFTLDDQPVGVPRGDGTVATEPVGAVDYRDLVREG
jgi:spore germination protein GerM